MRRGGGGVPSWNVILECNKHWALGKHETMVQLKARHEPNRSEANQTESSKRAESRSSNNRKRTASLRGCVYVSVRVSVCEEGGLCMGKLFNFFCNFPFHFVLPWRWLWLWSWTGAEAEAALVLLCGLCLWQIHEWAIFILHFLTDPHSEHTDTLIHTYIHTHTCPSLVHLTTFCANWSIYLFGQGKCSKLRVSYIHIYTVFAYIQRIYIYCIYI